MGNVVPYMFGGGTKIWLLVATWSKLLVAVVNTVELGVKVGGMVVVGLLGSLRHMEVLWKMMRVKLVHVDGVARVSGLRALL